MNNWTIIFLINGENNLINESIKTIEEIYRAGSHNKVKLLLIFDGVQYGKFSKEFARPALYEINAENGFYIDKPVETSESENLVKPETLISFLNHIKKQYPAKQYGFFYKGHGGSGGTDISSAVFIEKRFLIPLNIIGRKNEEELIEKHINDKLKDSELEGVYNFMGYSKHVKAKRLVMAIYTNSKRAKTLSYQTISQCLKKVFKQKIAFVCLDCCWGQQIENAFVFADTTDYFVASADESPALGIGYQEMLAKVIQRPHIRPDELANMIVAVYFYRNYSDYDSPVPEFREMGVSFTNVKTASLLKSAYNKGKNFEEKMKQLSDHLIANISKLTSTIMSARIKCKDYTYKNTESLEVDDIVYEVFNIDLAWFLTALTYYNESKDEKLDKLINEVLLFLGTKVITSFLASNYRNPILGNDKPYTGGKGITILFPVNQEQAEGCNSLYQATNHPFYVKTNWLKFLQAYYNEIDTIVKAADYKATWKTENMKQVPTKFYKTNISPFKTSTDQQNYTHKRFLEQLKKNDNVSNWGPVIKAKNKK